MKKIVVFLKYSLIGFLLFGIYHTSVISSSDIVVPVKKIQYSNIEKDILKNNLKYLGAPPQKIGELSEAILLTSEITKFDTELIIALIKTESNFQKNAISCKNYKGLMQTPSASFLYSDVDILHGARILEDKMKYANGNLVKALTLYKGGNNSVAKKYAMETYHLYNNLLDRSEKIRKEIKAEI